MNIFEAGTPEMLAGEVERITQEYLLTARGGDSDLSELTPGEREEMLSLLQDELGLSLEEEQVEALQHKRRLRLEDLVSAFRRAQKQADEDLGGYY
ncbi:MAG: hypothetical protein IMX01_03790 [Limnochordaceae bacterium]|nr:hypothetical protein [Limnochordaceae bacterium]